ncbi:hypothetical protein LCGC14_0477450 [marine sediment metagenome]|uniref:LamG-like jellyroll fold domain-containing protein n=1 Tax=marine sediment metagenome TaxID=412755 RepID=A0A0F9SFL8_9ZZZZ
MKKLMLLIFITILLIGIVNAIDFDDVKSYDIDKKIYTLENFFGLGKNIADLELKTPQNNIVPRGYQKVAEIEIRNREFDYDQIINGIELYNIKDNMNEVVRNVDYKYKTFEEVIVNDYKNVCTIKTSTNGTIYEECSQELAGNHIEQKQVWKDFTKNSLLKTENITLGIFTDVKKNDKIEWIINVYGNERLTAWALWTESMIVDVIAHYDMNETSGTNTDNVFDHTNNGTSNNMSFIAWFIENGYDFNGIDTDITFNRWIQDETFNWTYNFWINVSDTSGDQRFFTPRNDTLMIARYGTTGEGCVVANYCILFDGTWRETGLVVGVGDTTMVTLSHNGTGLRFGLNGTYLSYFEGTPVAPSGINTFGAGSGGVNFADMQGDEFTVLNRSVSDTELLNDWYNGGEGRVFRDVFTPIITLNSPVDNFSTLNQTIIFNGTVDSPTNVTLFIDGTLNETNSSGINDTNYLFTKTISDGNHNWTYESCNSFGCSIATTRTFTISRFLENSQTFNPFTFETKSEEFIINITTDPSSTPSSANLIYNGTDKGSATVTSLGNNNFNISQTIDIPTGDGNNSWLFNLTIDSVIESSSSQQQSVGLINLTFCQAAPQNIPYLNFTFTNETTNQEDVTAFIDSSWTYFLGGGSVTKDLSYANATEAFNYDFCFNPPNQTLTTSVNISYNNPESQQRISNLVFSTLTNLTTQQQLFLLPTNLGLFTQFFTQDTIGNTLVGVLATITRTLVGSPITITSDTTDGSGLVVFFLNPDVTYTATFSKTGFLDNVFSFIPITDLRTVTMGSTTITIVNGSTISLGTSYEIQPSNESLNNNTIVTFSFNVTSGETITLISMNITNSTTQRLFVSNAGQGFISGTVNTDNNTRLFGEFIIQTDNETLTIKRVWFIGSEFIGDYSLFRQLTLFNDYGFDEFIKFLIVLATIVGLLIFMSGDNQIEDEIKMAVITLAVWGFSIVRWLDTGIVVGSSTANINALTQFSNQYGIAILTTAGATYFILRRILREI